MHATPCSIRIMRTNSACVLVAAAVLCSVLAADAVEPLPCSHAKMKVRACAFAGPRSDPDACAVRPCPPSATHGHPLKLMHVSEGLEGACWSRGCAGGAAACTSRSDAASEHAPHVTAPPACPTASLSGGRDCSVRTHARAQQINFETGEPCPKAATHDGAGARPCAGAEQRRPMRALPVTRCPRHAALRWRCVLAALWGPALACSFVFACQRG